MKRTLIGVDQFTKPWAAFGMLSKLASVELV